MRAVLLYCAYAAESQPYILVELFGFVFLFVALGGAVLVSASHLLSTFFTQATPLAILVAKPFEELVLTLPVRVTTPPLVATLMVWSLSDAVPASLACTLSVICPSVVNEQSTVAGLAFAGLAFLVCAQTVLLARVRASTLIRNLFMVSPFDLVDSNWRLTQEIATSGRRHNRHKLSGG